MRKLLLVGLMTLMSLTNAFAQISGKVIDAETGDVLPGATILIEGTQDGTVSGFDGTFSIDVSEGEGLIISYIGYSTAVVSATLDLVVALQPDLNVLGEVVVSSGVIDVAKVRETPVAVSSKLARSLRDSSFAPPEVLIDSSTFPEPSPTTNTAELLAPI